MVLSKEANKFSVVDVEAGKRYEQIVSIGQKMFANSALVDANKPLTFHDLLQIRRFHVAVSPQNALSPWRLTNPDTDKAPNDRKSVVKGNIVDSSTYGNWRSVGGPLEHIELASRAARLMTRHIQAHLRSKEDLAFRYHYFLSQLTKVDPYHISAAAALHDEGREITHTYYSNERIGNVLLRRMNIRQDLIDVMPEEKVMLLPAEQDMNEYLLSLHPESVIVRIADEFGKRLPKTNRLYQPSDYDAWNRQEWADGYMKKPDTGRPSDRWMRTQMQLHVDNVPRYFQGLDNWLKVFTTLTLGDLTEWLSTHETMLLPPLQK